MKILMLAPQPILQPRGTPISVLQRLKALSALDHHVDLVTYHLGENVDIPGVEFHRIPNIPFIQQIKIGPSWAKIVLDTVLMFKAISLLLRRSYHVIHSHEESAYFGIFLAKLFNTLHMYDMHSCLPVQLKNFKFWGVNIFVSFFRTLERWTLNLSDTVITIDDELFSLAKDISPNVSLIKIDNLALWDGSNQDYEEQVIKIKETLKVNGKLSVVYTGSFEQYQGLELLLESAKIVREQYANACIILVGGHPDQVEKLRKIVKKKNLEDFVWFTGIVAPEDVSLYLMLADVLISPRLDGTSVPLKIYSYLQSGKPIIATNLPTHTQILNDETSLLVEPTKEAMAEGILKILNDPHVGKHLGQNGKNFVEEQYSWDIYLSKVQKIYQELELNKSYKGTPSEI